MELKCQRLEIWENMGNIDKPLDIVCKKYGEILLNFAKFWKIRPNLELDLLNIAKFLTQTNLANFAKFREIWSYFAKYRKEVFPDECDACQGQLNVPLPSISAGL